MQKQAIVATLVAALVTAAGRPHSIGEVLQLQQDFYMAMYPTLGQATYREWSKNRDAVLAKAQI